MVSGSSSALATSNTYIKYKINVTETATSVTNNTSTVKVTVTCYRTNSGYTTYGSGTVYVTIDGTTYTADITSSQKITDTAITLFTKTVTVTHGTAGTKTLTVSAHIDHSRFSSSSQSYSIALSTIPRASSLTVSNGTLGTSQTLTVTRQSTSFTHTIVYTCGTASGTICTKSKSTSISFTPPISLASQNTTGTSVSVVFTITTYSGSTSIGSSSYTKSMYIPSSVAPKCSISNITDTVIDVSAYGYYLQNASKPKVTVTATTSYGSAIKSYAISIDGNTYSSNPATASKALSTAGEITITAKLTDARGRTGSTSTTITAIEYVAPQISTLSVHRCDSDGTENTLGDYCKVSYSCNVTSLDNQNSGTLSLVYVSEDGISETVDLGNLDVTLLEDGEYEISKTDEYIFTADSESTYTVKLLLTDNFVTSTKTTSVSTAVPIIHFNDMGNSIAFGKVCEQENAVEFGWDIYLKNTKMPIVQYGSGTITPTAANTPSYTDIIFPVAFTTAPKVQLTPLTAVPGTEVLGVGINNVTTTGFRAWLTRTNTGATGINWVAFGI